MSQAQPIDVRDMAIVHRTFRAHAEAARLVRAAPAPSPIKTALDAASAGCEQPSAETGEALAAALDQLNPAAQRHLDAEEQKVVPLAAVTLTQQEWDALGKHGVAQIPGGSRAIALGMLLDPRGEADRAHMKRLLPTPVRMLYPFLIERPWKKYASALRTGT